MDFRVASGSKGTLLLISDLLNRAHDFQVVGFTINADVMQFRFEAYMLRHERLDWSNARYTLRVLTDDLPVVWQDGKYTDGPWKDGDHLSIVLAELRRRVEEAEAAEHQRIAAEQRSAEQKRQDALAVAAQAVKNFGRAVR